MTDYQHVHYSVQKDGQRVKVFENSQEAHSFATQTNSTVVVERTGELDCE